MLSLTHILKEALVYTSIFFGFASFPDEGGNGAQRTFKLESEGLLSADGYLLGLGIADITGPVVEAHLMGYADLNQKATGLHMRQWSRAFIVADPKNASERIVFINSDIAMSDTGIRRTIVSELEARFQGLYTNANVALVGTHSHSGVAGYAENLLLQLSSLGYINQTAQAIIDGTVLAVQRAHESLKPGSLSLGSGTVLDANINRSPSAYVANPKEERERYEYNVDKEMTVLRFDDETGDARGLLSFFPVHGTSILGNNTLVSTDNKGMAAYLYESLMNPESMPGRSSFVAGFVQSNVGDTSPNTLGAFCESPGKPWDGESCEWEHSTCGNLTGDCHGRGPGFRISDFESNRIIGTRQFEGAKNIMESTLSSVHGPVRSVHTYVNMSQYTFTLPNGTAVSTCPAALGYGFAGGTTDWPGHFDFIQGHNSSNKQNPFWEAVKRYVTPPPSQEQIDCHYPKPILLDTGFAHKPYEWSPAIVDVQMLRIGNLVIIVFPGEMTTMAGRRLSESIRTKLIDENVIGDYVRVVIAGPANTYSHYVSTREEYNIQRFEGASTVYGPFTLEAYMDKYTTLVPYLFEKASGTPASDPPPPEQTSKAISLKLPMIQDNPLTDSFGDVINDVDGEPYYPGMTVQATFAGANPRNNLRLDDTFLTVDRNVDGDWVVYRTDSHPSTTYEWFRNSTLLGTSTVVISWTVEDDAPEGIYRLTYIGDSRSILGSITPFSSTSSEFSVSR